MNAELTETDLTLLIAALDSHCYWELCDPDYRRDGFVMEPGADDHDAQTEIAQASELAARLEDLLRRKGAMQ